MSRKLYGRGPWRRLLSTFLVVAFTLSFTGIGFAAPANKVAHETATTTDVQAPVADAPAPQDAPPAPTEVAPPADPAPAAEPAPTDPSVEPAPKTADNGGRHTRVGGSAKAGHAPAPVSDPAPVDPAAAVAPIVAAAVTAQSVAVSLDGWRTTPSLGWVSGDLGKDWNEGDWVPYRFIIDNSGSGSAASIGGFSLIYDHLNANKNAIGVDRTQNWFVYYTKNKPGFSDPKTHAASATISPSSQDVGYPSGGVGDAEFLKTTVPSGQVVVPAGYYGVVMFEAHLSITAWWQQHSPARYGSSYYPGSSMQMRVESPSGAKTVPIPIPPKPSGYVTGIKFNDVNRNKIMDTGEPPLSGWVFHLTGGPAGFPLDLTATSAADGTFAFPALPPATYSLNEEAKADWSNSTTLPVTINLVSGQTVLAKVGNYHSDVRKSFELSIDNAPAGATFFVRYTVNGVTQADLALTGTGPYTGSVMVPYGAVITTQWYAHYGTEDLLLGSTGPETLTSNFTNRYSYDSSAWGRKYGDTNGNGVKDAGESYLSGWTVKLYRTGGASPVLYATQVTDGSGRYQFTDVLPGSYYVEETVQAGWWQTDGPDPFTMPAGGADRGPYDFGNILVNAAIDLVKTGPSLAHVGDTVTYHFVVTNTGNTPLTNVTVSDPMLSGVIRTYVGHTFASGESTSFDYTYVIPAGTDPVDNTATAAGDSPWDGRVHDHSSWTIDIIHPAISIAKTVDFDSDGSFHDSEQGLAGWTAVWKLIVSNTGDTSLASVVVTDTNGSSFNVGTLAAGASKEITYTEVISADKTNNASTKGTDVLGKTVKAGPDAASVDMIAPHISVKKYIDLQGGASYSDVSETGYPGNTATWKIRVTNDGDVALTSVVVTDTNGQSWNVGSLAKDAFWEQVYTTSPTADVLNTARAVGTPPVGPVVRGSDDAAVDLIAPALSIVKTVDFNGDGTFSGSETYYKGRTAVWKILVTNTGDVPVYDIQVTDSSGPVNGTFDLLTNGASKVMTYTETINSDKTNSASAAGYDGQENPVSAGPATASVHPIEPKISIAKTVDFNGDGTFSDSEQYYSGADAVWKIVVTNNGDVALTDITITDSNGHSFGAPFSLAAGASKEITYTTNPTSDTTNNASVTAHDPLGGDVSARDSASVDTVLTGLTVSKTVDFNGDAAYTHVETYYVGSTAYWKVVISNTGDVALGIVVTDSNGHVWAPFQLAAHTSTTTIYSETITADKSNRVDVTATDPFQGQLTGSDTASVDPIDPGLEVSKYVDYNGDGEFNTYEDGRLGWTATWKIVVHNSGDVLMSDVGVSDTNGQSFGPFDLAAGASRTITYTTVPTAYTYNTATASGTDPLGGTVGPIAGAAGATPFDPHISIVKTANPTVILSGDMVTYSYLVTNDGDMPLFDIDVTDVPIGYIGHIDYLAVDGQSTVSTTVPIGVDTHNVGTVVGHYDSGEPGSEQPGTVSGTVTANDDADVDVVRPALSIAKTVEFDGNGVYGEDETNLSGSTAKWRIVVTNSGDVPLSSVVVTDTNGQSFGPFSLAVGASQTFDYNTNPTVDTINVATASGLFGAVDTQIPPRKVGPVSDSARVRVFLPFTPPDLAIVKSADKTTANPGETVVYTLTYSNVGKGAATDFTIVDDFDQRYVTVTDAAGGTVAGGKITWNIAGPLYAGESGTITYKVKISDTMPAGKTNVDNVVVITHPDDPNPDNDRDDWRVVVSTEPFLPFTGGEAYLVLYVVIALAAAGFALRRLGRKAA